MIGPFLARGSVAMDNIMLTIAVALGFTVFWWATAGLRSETGGPRHRERRSGFTTSTPFHAVSVRAGSPCCEAVKQIENRRYLSDEAPGLPLPQCGGPSCHCTYLHHSDRRSGARDRRYVEAPAPEVAQFWQLKNRRSTAGRRGDDLQIA
jgi:hypothetical protein